MGIRPTSVYTGLSLIANSPQQRKTSASATSISVTSTIDAADKITISQAARDRVAEGTKNGGTYDFTNITPNQIRDTAEDLFSSGKISSQQHLMMLTTGLTIGKIGENGKYIPSTEAENTSQSNTPMNYVQFSKDRISYLESAGLTSDPQYGYEGWKGLLATLQDMTSGRVA